MPENESARKKSGLRPEPEDILEKFDGVALAEIYAAISYALSNLEEITGEIEREDRLSAQASQTAAMSAA